MSEASDIFDEAAADMFQAAADPGPAFFNPALGDPVSCYVDIRRDIQLASGGTDGQVYALGTVLEYLLAETGREVVVGESFTDGTTTWKVEQLLTNDGRFSKVVVTT